jgi:hypothetical protein
MAKETTEEVDKIFDGFNFLNGSIPKAASKKLETAKEEVNDSDELTEEDFAAIEASKEEFKNKKATKKLSEEFKQEEEEEELKEEIKDEESKTNEFSGFAKYLSEEGVIDLEEEDIFESEKDLAKVVGRTIKNGIAQDRSKLPEDGQKFLEFLDGGGKPSDFHKYYYGDASFEEFDITSEENQKYVIREALKLEEYTDEEIEETLTDFEDTGKTDKKAEMYLKKLQKVEKQNQALLLDTQKAFAKEQEIKRTAEWDEFRKGLFDKDTIGGFKMTPKMKEDTWTYMTKVVDKKIGATQMQIDDKENKDAKYMYAYLLKNKWDIKSLEKQVETKQVSKLRDKLSNYSDTRTKSKTASVKVEVENENDNPFKGFKNL